MSDMKMIIARAKGIVDRLDEQGHSAIEKAEILALTQTLVNIEVGRTTRAAPPPALALDETVQ